MGMAQEAGLDHREVQDIVHAALGRQLRLAMVACVLLMVAGFVLGHYVADAQARAASERLEGRVSAVVAQMNRLQHEAAAGQRAALDRLAAIERLRSEEAARDREALRLIVADAELKRSACLADLEPFVKRRLSVPTAQVIAVVNEFVDRQAGQTRHLLSIAERRAGNAELPSGAPRRADTIEAPPPLPPPLDGTTGGGRAAAEPNYLPFGFRGDASSPALGPPGAAAGSSRIPGGTMLFDAPGGAMFDAPGNSARRFAPQAQSGYLFFSRSQPRRLNDLRLADPDLPPLPPR